MKRVKILLVVSCLLIVGLGSQCNQSVKNDGNPIIKVGAILPLTGNSAVWGVPTKEGIELALDSINNKGGLNGKKLEVIFEDTKAEPASAVSSVEKLINVDKVVAIIDNSNSSVTLAVASIVERSKIPLLVTGASSPKIKDAGDYVFRIWNSDDLEGELAANFAIDNLKVKKVSVLYVNNNYGIGLKDVFQKSYESKNGQVISAEAFDENSKDFKTQVEKVIKSDSEAIYLVCYPKQGAIILQQLKELGNKKQLLGAVAFEDPDLLKNTGDAANGLIYPLPAPVDSNEPYFESFKQDYVKKFGKEVPFLAAEGYDGLNVLLEAMKPQSGISSEAIKNNLYGVKDYKGVSGLISFDSFGEVHKPFGIREIIDGKLEWKIKVLQ